MSLKNRLTEKSGNIVDTINNIDRKNPSTTTSSKTGPGQMLAFSKEMEESNNKINLLEKQLEEFKESSPAKLIEPSKISRSIWANRSEQSFTDKEFQILKESIDASGGNVQPIKVRKIAGNEEKFELIFGHRRHQACLELGIRVLALVAENMEDQQLFLEMDQENRARKDLSPWEQGKMYQRALDEKLWPSQNKLAKALSLSQGNVSSALQISQIPKEIMAVFSNPNDLTFRWVREILKAIKRDSDGVLDRAQSIKNRGYIKPSKAFQILISEEATFIEWNEKIDEVRLVRRKGNLSISCGKIKLNSQQEQELKKMIENCLRQFSN